LVGRTVPSFRIALEMEMTKWKGYRKCLRQNEREIFDRMMDNCRIHASASGMATRPNPLEAMFLSVLLEHQRKIEELERRGLRPNSASSTATKNKES
jgi:hypothetical protein